VQGTNFFTLGAGPSRGNLVADYNRTADADMSIQLSMTSLGLWEPVQIEQMLTAFLNYNNNLVYTPFPTGRRWLELKFFYTWFITSYWYWNV